MNPGREIGKLKIRDNNGPYIKYPVKNGIRNGKTREINCFPFTIADFFAII